MSLGQIIVLDKYNYSGDYRNAYTKDQLKKYNDKFYLSLSSINEQLCVHGLIHRMVKTASLFFTF